ncbi:MAG: diadenylate cyclase [Bdellovibrionales bacterium]|nr:diadenylate cyclase [Bdellovibrionales bacterium]
MLGSLIKNQDKRESAAVVEHAFSLAKTLSIETLLIQISSRKQMERILGQRDSQKIGWILMGERAPELSDKQDVIIPVPESPLTRVSQMRVALFLAVAQGFATPKESVIAISGAFGTQRLDTLMILNAGIEFPWYQKQSKALENSDLPIQTIERVISWALRLATEGREGRPIGTIFVIGELDEMQKYTHQLILNPLAGHPKKLRTFANTGFFETLRELTGLDGAFLISPNGTVETAGTYLGAASEKTRTLPGLGARHTAAAAFTSRCRQTIAVVLSESSGTVTLFQGGDVLLKLEKLAPRHKERTFKKG